MTSFLDMNDFGLTEMNFDELTLIDGGGFWQGVKDFFSGFGDGACCLARRNRFTCY
jgi:hypothetical protein